MNPPTSDRTSSARAQHPVYASAADLGRAIRRLRLEHKPRLSAEKLALNAGMHTTYLSGIERGLRNPSWAKLNGLAKALALPLARIIQVAEQERRIGRVRSRIEAEDRSRIEVEAYEL